jgi:hypothetical protein
MDEIVPDIDHAGVHQTNADDQPQTPGNQHDDTFRRRTMLWFAPSIIQTTLRISFSIP